MKKQTAILSLIVGLGITVAYQGCGGIHENPGSDLDSSANAANLATSDAAGFAAFQAGFYAFTKTQNCVKCHGAIQSPKFADPDPAIAYGYFKTLVTANDPTHSIIITYAGNSHCQDTPCSDPNVRPQVTSLLSSWAAAEGSSGGGGTAPASVKYLTTSLPLPATLPLLTAAPAVLRFSLTSLGIPALSGAIFEVELNRFNAAGNYRVARAKIQGNTGIVTVTGIHVYIKASTIPTGIGIEDANQGLAWTGVTAVVPVLALPKTLPTTPLTAVPMVSNALSILPASTADVMTIGFDDIENGATATPSVIHFTDLVSANQTLGVFTQNCVACHSGANLSGGLDLTNYTASKAMAATIQVRINSTTSPMPPSGLISTASRQVVNTWVTGGALQ